MPKSNRPKRSSHLSPRELAAALGVSESSLKRWADDGRLVADRTAGGHRRIAVAEAVRFVREAGLPVRWPELLGHASSQAEPDVASKTGVASEAHVASKPDVVTERLHAALAADRGEEARGIIVSAYVGGRGLGSLFDGPVRDALARIGDVWEHDEAGIFLEHRATETCLAALAELRLLLPPVPADAPVALGGGGAGDPYQVPSAMAAVILAEAGYAVRNLGADTPPEALLAAVRHYRPRLVWQSFSAVPRNSREAAASVLRLADAVGEGRVVIGGRGSRGLPLASHPGIDRIDSMTELAAFARGAVGKPTG
jgi:MerR family transcriptional regulator, light-induced transcriptional regulator